MKVSHVNPTHSLPVQDKVGVANIANLVYLLERKSRLVVVSGMKLGPVFKARAEALELQLSVYE